MKKKFKEGFTLIELIIVMVIMGVLASVAVPRYLDSIANAEESAENAVINSIRNGLKQYAGDKLYKEGRPTWPDNPFDALNKVPASYDKSGTVHISEMDDSDWIFTSDKSDEYPNAIVHRRKEDSLAVWTYNKETGDIGFDNPPYQPQYTVYRPDVQ